MILKIHATISIGGFNEHLHYTNINKKNSIESNLRMDNNHRTLIGTSQCLTLKMQSDCVKEALIKGGIGSLHIPVGICVYIYMNESAV